MALNVLKNKLGEILNPIIPRYHNLTKYSTTEIKTGKKWKDGKDIYSKNVTIKIPNSISGSGVQTVELKHGIANIENITNVIHPIFYLPDDLANFYNFPIISQSGHITGIKEVNSTAIVLRSVNESWANINWTLSCTLEYTKK